MDILSCLADAWTMEPERARIVGYLRKQLETQNGDLRAYSLVQLYKIYSTEAEARLFLSIAFRRLARHHLDNALVAANTLAEPWAILAGLQLQDGDLWGGMENVSKYVELQRAWIQRFPDVEESDQLELCRYVALGASTRSELGQFSGALRWYAEALEKFKTLTKLTRVAEPLLERAILIGTSGCLLLQFKYEEAQQFIDLILADSFFAESPARSDLLASKELLTGLAEATRDFELPPQTENLWESLMDIVQRCDNTEKVREARRQILSAVKTHDVNREVQRLATAVQTAMEKQQALLRNIKSQPAVTAATNKTAVDLSKITDPDLKKQLEGITHATQALVERSNLDANRMRDLTNALVNAALRFSTTNIESVREMARDVYHIPIRYRVQWMFWRAIQNILRLAGVGYLIEILAESYLEEHGKKLLEMLAVRRIEIIMVLATLLIFSWPGKFAEQKLEAWILPKYKRVLRTIVANRTSQLWMRYNNFLDLLRKMDRDLNTAKEQLRGGP